MAVGIGIIGRDVTMTVGGSTLVGVTSKGISFSNEMGETTDDSSSGWQEFLGTPLKKGAEVSISGIVKNLELVKAYFSSSQAFPITASYPDGSSLTFDAVMSSGPNITGEANGLITFEVTFTSTGEINFTAGV
jgi:predicted secreted protein